MTDIPFQLSIANAKSTLGSKRKQLPTNNVCDNHQGNLPKSSDATLPIITLTLSARSNFKQKFIRMASNNKSARFSNHIPIDLRTAQIKTHVRSSSRSNVSPIPKSSLSYPTTIMRSTSSHNSNQQQQQQQNPRCLYVLKTATSFHRTISARVPNHAVPLQQPQQPINTPRPYNQYEHFLAYLRRQSLARLRRKQQEEEGHSDHVETTITLNLNKQHSIQTFQSISHQSISHQSISHQSLSSSNTDLTSIPSISIKAKRASGLSSPSRLHQRSTSTYPQTPTPMSKTPVDDQLYTSSSVLVTPRNSVVDDPSMPPMAKPHGFHLNDDMLNYRYVSDESGIPYQGHLLSTPV
jgi:hypothetical protein